MDPRGASGQIRADPGGTHAPDALALWTREETPQQRHVMKTHLISWWAGITALWLGANQLATAETVNWTNTTGGYWSVPGNWDPNRVPGPGDQAEIGTQGDYAVTCDTIATIADVQMGSLWGTGGPRLVIASGAALTCVDYPNGITVSDGSLMVERGGTLNVRRLVLYGPLTNAGTINISNGFCEVFNNDTTNVFGTKLFRGGLVNLAGGRLECWELTGVSAFMEPGAYLINQAGAQIRKCSGAGNAYTRLSFPTLVNQGDIPALHGGLRIEDHVTLDPGGSLNVALNSATLGFGKNHELRSGIFEVFFSIWHFASNFYIMDLAFPGSWNNRRLLFADDG